MADWEATHEEKVAFIEKKIKQVEDQVAGLASRLEELLEDALLLYYGQERVRASAALYARIDRAFKNIEDYIKKSKYATKVQDMVRSFDNLLEYNARIQQGLNGLTVELSKLSPFMARSVDAAVSALIGAGLKTEIITPMRDLMIRSIAGGATLKDAKASYLNYVRAAPDRKTSRLEQWVIEMTRDTMLGVDGAINAFIRDEYDMDAYRYVGSLVQDSRPQCRKWVAMKIIPVKKLAEEISWAYTNGKGMMPGTNPSTFPIQRGGFNCRHYAYPTFLDSEDD